MRSKLRSESVANRDSYVTTWAPEPRTKAALTGEVSSNELVTTH